MRTTLSIDDELHRAASVQARRMGLTLGGFVEQSLRDALAMRPRPSVRAPLPVFRGGTGPRAGVDLDSTRDLTALLDDGSDLDDLR